jgi:hypothetical protein
VCFHFLAHLGCEFNISKDLMQAEIYNKPDKYVELDEELPTTLLDQIDVCQSSFTFC